MLSPHAVSRMVERGVSIETMRQLLESPDWIVAQGPKWIFAKSFPNREDNSVAAVLLEKRDKDLWIVLTVMINFQQK